MQHGRQHMDMSAWSIAEHPHEVEGGGLLVRTLRLPKLPGYTLWELLHRERTASAQRAHHGGVFAQRAHSAGTARAQCAHSANYYGDYPGNSPENDPPAESCTTNSKLKNSNI